MKLLLILTAVLSAAQLTDQPYELKGEAPGMSLKQFRSNHKHAECSNRTAHETSCRVYDGVSFAGVLADTYKGCTLLECSAQGIFAKFVDGRLVYLMYGVSPGSSAEIIATLKRKFGEPNGSTNHSATWKNSVGYLYVSETLVPGSDGSAKDIATSIASSLNNQGEDKDI